MAKPDYLMQARIKEACAAAGVLESAFDDFIIDHEAFKFTEAEIGTYIEQCRTEKPHRFAIQNDHDAELCQSAFIAKNMTAQSRLFREVGSQRFAELKALYADGVPESVKKNTKTLDHSKNPWANIPENLDAKTGMYNARAVGRMAALAKAMPLPKVAEIAASVGAKIGDVRPPRRAA
jgi:hypothetical protein